MQNAARISSVIMESGKQYVCLMRLHGETNEKTIRETLNLFTGDIYQVPPVRSSVKRQLRVRTIYRTNFLEMQGRDVLFTIACSAGTYVRKYCTDIGLYLGTGAHMQELRRTRAGPFTEEESATLLDLYAATKRWKEEGEEDELRNTVRPIEEALKLLPKIYVLDSAVDAICHGASAAVNGVSKVSSEITTGEQVAIYTLKGEAVAVGEALMNTEEILASDRGLAARTKKVLMKRGTYPPIWKHKHHPKTKYAVE